MRLVPEHPVTKKKSELKIKVLMVTSMEKIVHLSFAVFLKKLMREENRAMVKE